MALATPPFQKLTTHLQKPRNHLHPCLPPTPHICPQTLRSQPLGLPAAGHLRLPGLAQVAPAHTCIALETSDDTACCCPGSVFSVILRSTAQLTLGGGLWPLWCLSLDFSAGHRTRLCFRRWTPRTATHQVTKAGQLYLSKPQFSQLSFVPKK